MRIRIVPGATSGTAIILPFVFFVTFVVYTDFRCGLAGLRELALALELMSSRNSASSALES
jgi:hypothetical protein